MMSDELVKRLRGWPMSTAGNVMRDAADRIEELEAQLAGQDHDVHPVEMAARIKELEAQLAEATALIAELKGQDDE
jgi:uncharacterized coiled-coil protein SlyX